DIGYHQAEWYVTREELKKFVNELKPESTDAEGKQLWPSDKIRMLEEDPDTKRKINGMMKVIDYHAKYMRDAQWRSELMDILKIDEEDKVEHIYAPANKDIQQYVNEAV